MSFATPLFLAALGLLVPIVVLFLVRRKREVVRVPSTLVWRLGARVVAKNKRFRDLRRLLALTACLLGVSALVLAAARPSRPHLPSTQVYVVDLSASMDGAPLREARRFLVRDVAALGPSDRVAIVTASADVKVALAPSPPGPALDAAIASLAARPEGASIEEAVALGARLAGRGHGARVVVLSDAPLDAEAVRLAGASVQLRRVGGGARENLGITALYSRPALDSTDDTLREATLTVASSSTRARRATVAVTEEGSIVLERAVEVEPGKDATTHITLRSGGRVKARVVPADGVADAVGVDDEALLDEPPRRKLRVGLVFDPAPAAGDATSAFFVRQALLASGVGEVIDVSPTEPSPRGGELDVAVVLRPGPGVPRDVPTLFIGQEPTMDGGPGPLLTSREAGASELHLRSVASDDPLLRGVGLDELTVLRARVAVPPRGARALVELDGGATLIAGGSGGHAWVWLGIDPAATDLVLRVAFPVLVSNVVAELGGGAALAAARTAPRSEVTLAAPEVMHPLPSAPDPRWRIPVSPSVALAIVGALFLLLEVYLTYRAGTRTPKVEIASEGAAAGPPKAFAT